MGSKAPLSINPEQTQGFRPGKVEGLILEKSCSLASLLESSHLFDFIDYFSISYPLI
jgi:hypothetical protein